jgi:membrane protease subunit HflC
MNDKKTEKHTSANETAVKAKKKRSFPIFKILIAVVLITAFFYFGFTCEVREGQCAVILRFGAVREEITDAGLYLKLPWPFESVVTYDNRLQYLESNYLETTTKDKRNVLLQSFVAWEIENPILYHNSVGSQGTVADYIKDQVFSAVNSVMGSYELKQLVSLDAAEIRIDDIQKEIYNRVSANCRANYGIDIQDVSFLKISLPDTNLQSVFDQMTADRQKDIDTILAAATRDANKITSDADAEAAEIIAGGITEAAAIKAKTETEVSRIYAEAQAANLELFQFLKQLDTFTASIGSNTVLVVKADEYPFNVLTQYGDYLTTEGDTTIVKDLTYILTKLPAADREALISAISALIEQASAGTGGQS